jgi:N-acetylmuramoyl-L-alanine amidase
MKIVISSGHGKYVPGAQGIISEVTEARKVVDLVAEFARNAGATVIVFHDDTSHDQDTNLQTIVSTHNDAGPHDLDVSVHFNNAYDSPYPKPIGTECFHYAGNSSMRNLAASVASEIALASGLIDRGPKDDGLYFTTHTNAPAILIEVCFVESEPDVSCYRRYFDSICESIAATITGEDIVDRPPSERPPSGASFRAEGTVSWFGGPDDVDGVSSSEGLAFWYSYDEAPWLFLPAQPPNTTGLARRLNPGIMYCAARWPYDIVSKEMLRRPSVQALVRNPANGREVLCYPADWGPNQETTGRAMDLSLAALEILDLQTDDEAILIYPASEAT